MVVTVEKVSIPPLVAGEAPHWDIGTQSLYLIDIMGKALVRYDLESDQAFIAKLDVTGVSFVIPVADSNGKFVVGSNHNILLVDWDGCSDKVNSMEIIYSLTGEPETNTINDAKCDDTGRLWFGTYNTTVFTEGEEVVANAKFYSYSRDEGCRVQASDFKVCNGLTFNPEWNALYVIDSMRYSIARYDVSDGNIENHEQVFNLKDNNIESCFPDGMTIDKEGNIWTALFGSSEVVCIDPSSGEILDKVAIPAAQVTSVAWGGPNLEDLYVTTGNLHIEGAKLPGLSIIDPDNDGCTFRITGLSTFGLPMKSFNL